MKENDKSRYFPIYKELADAYDFYNEALFNNRLPKCIITLSTKVNYFGCFRPNNFISTNNKEEKMHEISLNMYYFALRQLPLTLSTLVHEMCHLKNYEDGEFGKTLCYHNKNFAILMKNIGLIPSATAEPGGKMTGQSMSHYIEEGGKFECKTKELINKGFLLPFVERIYNDVKEYTVDNSNMNSIKKSNKPGYYIDENKEEFKGEEVKCGKDENGEEIIKIIKKDVKKLKNRYTCKCGFVLYGRPNLDITCNKCNEKFVFS